MIDNEVCRIYKRADEDLDRIELIHELTLMPKKQIAKILTDNGFEIANEEKSEKLKMREIRFMELYKLGISDKKIGDAMGLAEGTIGLLRESLSLPPNRRIKEEKRKEFKALYDKGLNDSEIAHELKLHFSTIWKWRNELSLSSNYRKEQKNE